MLWTTFIERVRHCERIKWILSTSKLVTHRASTLSLADVTYEMSHGGAGITKGEKEERKTIIGDGSDITPTR